MIIKKNKSKKEIIETKKEDAKSDKVKVEKSVEALIEESMQIYKEIDISEIDFKERVERRRGDRRRGYRRIDERTLVSRAQEEAYSIKNKAHDEGYKQGLDEATSDISKLNDSLSEFLNSKRDVYDYVSGDILELAIQIAEKIIKKEVTLSDEVLKSILNEVLDKVSNDEQRITLKVSPDDYDVAVDITSEILNTKKANAKVNVIEDENIEKGSCVLVASNGVIDANFKTQLQIIKKAFNIYN